VSAQLGLSGRGFFLLSCAIDSRFIPDNGVTRPKSAQEHYPRSVRAYPSRRFHGAKKDRRLLFLFLASSLPAVRGLYRSLVYKLKVHRRSAPVVRELVAV